MKGKGECELFETYNMKDETVRVTKELVGFRLLVRPNPTAFMEVLLVEVSESGVFCKFTPGFDGKPHTWTRCGSVDIAEVLGKKAKNKRR